MKREAAALALMLTMVAALADDVPQGAAPAASAPPSAKPVCTLPQIASLDMQTETSGLVTVPVTVDGVTGRWTVDTGNTGSMIGATIAIQQKLRINSLRIPGVMMGGLPIRRYAIAPTVVFAGMHGSDVELSIAPESILDNDTIGMLGPDILQHYDIDFDFAAGKLNVFSPNHCPGKVIYWTKGTYAQVPFKLDGVGHITIPVMLDGKAMTAVVDTGAQGSAMSFATMNSLFGIDEKNPALKPLGDIPINNMAPTPAYRYPFATLTFEGVQVGTPNITVLKDTGMGDDAPELLLGIETLRQLHLYIAYGEGNIYVTPAEER
ncbi:MAG TPA: aspartyl protease family protein [Rhizomicrobium sp.]|nr:aspartyl protease family protein [Rhizomicrobium sp.]